MSELPVELYKVAQIRALEQLALQQAQVSESTLMEGAGLAAWLTLVDYFEGDLTSLIVVTGSGNNGGDGYVLARLAHETELP